MPSTLKNIDYSLVIVYLLLMTAGLFNLYSSDNLAVEQSSTLMSSVFGKQLIWAFISIFVAIIVISLDAVFYSVFANIIYLSVIGLLFLILIFGVVTNGAKSWLDLGGIRIQPSEFAKFATALALARYIGNNGYKFSLRYWQNNLIVAAIIFTPVLLILLQPDVGSALVFTAFIFVLYREGLPGTILLLILVSIIVFVLALRLPQLPLLTGIAVFYLFIIFISVDNKNFFTKSALSLIISFSTLYFIYVIAKLKINLIYILLASIIIWLTFTIIYTINKKEKAVPIIILFTILSILVQFSTHIAFTKILKPHQRNRIEVLFDDSVSPERFGYNLRQSKIAIGAGGFSGKGYLKGTQTKLNFVPAHNTDFIFCTIAEEWGFVGTVALFALYLFLIIKIIIKSEKQLSTFSRVYGYSVASIFIIHFLINIGMTIGLVPVIGIPLPFFSYGGSAMLGFTILLFIFIKLDSQKELKL